jgi:hypothetical protein
MFRLLSIRDASQDGFSGAQSPSQKFNDPEGDILWHKPRGAGVSIRETGLLAVGCQNEQLLACDEDVAMPVCIANLVIDELSSARRYVSRDIQQMENRFPDTQSASEDYLDCG